MCGNDRMSSFYYTSFYYARQCNKKSFYSQPWKPEWRNPLIPQGFTRESVPFRSREDDDEVGKWSAESARGAAGGAPVGAEWADSCMFYKGSAMVRVGTKLASQLSIPVARRRTGAAGRRLRDSWARSWQIQHRRAVGRLVGVIRRTR